MKHDLHLGDCLEIMRELETGSVDMILTDPPYGTTHAPWDHAPDYSALFAEIWRVVKPNGAVLIFTQLPPAVDVINASRQNFRYEWIWRKRLALGFLNAQKMPLRAHEMVLVFYRRLPTYNPQFTPGTPYKRMRNVGSELYGNQHQHYTDRSAGNRYPHDVLEIKSERGPHSCSKPTSLLEYLIRTYTHDGETVLDPFMGSGTTGVACQNSGRNFIGIELDEHFFTTAQTRLPGVD